MKRYLTAAIAAACIFATSAAQAIDQQPTEAETLMSQLYLPLTQAYAAQDWEQVETMALRLIAAGADLEDLAPKYAVAAAHTHSPAEGEAIMQAYLQAEPDDYVAWQMLGEIRELGDDSAGAIEAYRHSASLAPAFARPWVSMARLQAETEPQQAVEAYNEAIRIFLLAKQPAAAVQLGSEAMAIDPTDLTLLMLMGDAMSMADMPNNALPFYAEAIACASDSDEADAEIAQTACYRIAHIYYTLGAYDKALGMVRNLADSQVRIDNALRAESLCLAAACCQRLGRSSDRERYLDKALEADPEGAQALYDGLLEL